MSLILADLFGVDGDETGSGPEVKERGLVSSDNTQNLQAFDDVLRKSRSVRKRYAQARSGLERTVQSKSAINLPKVAKEKSQMYESAHSLSLRVLPNKNDLVGSAMNKSKSVAKLKVLCCLLFVLLVCLHIFYWRLFRVCMGDLCLVWIHYL